MEYLKLAKKEMNIPTGSKQTKKKRKKNKKIEDRSGVDAYLIRRTLMMALWDLDVDHEEIAFVAPVGFTEDWNQIEHFGAGSAVVVFESKRREHGVLYY